MSVVERLFTMFLQQPGKFTLDGGCSLHSVNFVQETDSMFKPPPAVVRRPLAVRVQENFLAYPERRLLDWLCKLMPRAVTPDILTGFGAAGAASVFAGYAATRLDPAFFWLSSFGFLMHWFGDSLDGSLARYRHIERPRYGNFLDPSIDAICAFVIMAGAGLSAYIRMDVALFALSGYFILCIYAYLYNNVARNLPLSFLAVGGTEMRIGMIGLNTWMYFGGDSKISIGPGIFSPYDLVLCGLGSVFVCLFAINVFTAARQLRLEER